MFLYKPPSQATDIHRNRTRHMARLLATASALTAHFKNTSALQFKHYDTKPLP